MSRRLPTALLLALAGALVFSATALSAPTSVPVERAGGAGFNLPTKRLEAAYKVSLQARRFSPDGCYPDPGTLARKISQDTGNKAGTSRGFGGLHRLNQVYVVTGQTNCEKLVMALRAPGGVYVLDSVEGTIRIRGHKGAATPGLAQPLRSTVLISKTFQTTKADTTQRFETLCPGGRYPVGGGMKSSPSLSADGEGPFPHSYERLGAQRGYHISTVNFDPSPGSTTPRQVTLQAVCTRGAIPATPTPHRTVYLRPGDTKTVSTSCPKGQTLLFGGFQRTDWRSDGGDYIAESRAVGTSGWTVTGHAYGAGSGELTAIAYCARSKRPVLTEVSSPSVPIAMGSAASTTTTACPAGTRLTSGGFSENGSTNGFIADGYLNGDGTWTASAYGFFGPVPGFTAYGYCLRARS
jgi:hypothetical protein